MIKKLLFFTVQVFYVVKSCLSFSMHTLIAIFFPYFDHKFFFSFLFRSGVTVKIKWLSERKCERAKGWEREVQEERPWWEAEGIQENINETQLMRTKAERERKNLDFDEELGKDIDDFKRRRRETKRDERVMEWVWEVGWAERVIKTYDRVRA